MTAHSHPQAPPEPQTASLWAGVIGSPLVWAAHFGVGYAFVPFICKHGGLYLLHINAAICLAIIALFFLLCFKNYAQSAGTEQIEGNGPEGRIIFNAALGMMISGLFFILTFAQGIAAFFLNPCWQ